MFKILGLKGKSSEDIYIYIFIQSACLVNFSLMWLTTVYLTIMPCFTLQRLVVLLFDIGIRVLHIDSLIPTIITIPVKIYREWSVIQLNVSVS
jgi:hypothetical protein